MKRLADFTSLTKTKKPRKPRKPKVKSWQFPLFPDDIRKEYKHHIEILDKALNKAYIHKFLKEGLKVDYATFDDINNEALCRFYSTGEPTTHNLGSDVSVEINIIEDDDNQYRYVIIVNSEFMNDFVTYNELIDWPVQ